MNQNQLSMLGENYAKLNGGKPFKHFYCPILLEKHELELCDGHVTPDSFGGCNKTIIQTKEVDNFFGRHAEAVFGAGTEAMKTSEAAIIGEGRSLVRGRVLVDDVPINFFPAASKKQQENLEKSTDRTAVEIHDGENGKYTIGIDLTQAEIYELVAGESKLEFEVSCDFRAEAVATLFHSAHLTMFSIMKYRYVFSAGGEDMARTLKRYYLANKDIRKDRSTLAQNTRDYFLKYVNRIRILNGPITQAFEGTISDGLFIAWQGSSGRYIAFGIFVKTPDGLSLVWIYGGDPNCAAEFFGLEKEHPETTQLRLMKFIPESEHEVKIAVNPRPRTYTWKEGGNSDSSF